MKIKALKNFSCNGVRKKVGEYLSAEECEKIGERFGEELQKSDFIQIEDLEPESDEIKGEVVEDQEPDVDLDKMDKVSLLSLAKDIGLEIHGRTGEDKIREMITEKLEA